MAGEISQAMLSAVRFRLGEPTASDVTDAEIYDHMNEAQLVLAMEEGLDAAMLPLTAIKTAVWNEGTYSYALPYDFLRERLVRVGTVMARRLRLQDMDRLRVDPSWTPSKDRPFYSIADGQILFHTNDEDPDELIFQVYYVRKPMWVRNVVNIANAGSSTWVLNTATNHNLTASNAGDTMMYEDSSTPALYAGVQLTMDDYVDADTISLRDYTSGSATGGRVVHTSRGQIQSTEDPLLPKLFHGPIMDWAVARCREQFGHFEEAARQRAHFIQRVERIKERYSDGRPFDGIAGDPGRRVPVQPQQQGG